MSSKGTPCKGRGRGGHTKTQRLGGKGWEWRLTPELTSTDDSKETLVRGGGTTPPMWAEQQQRKFRAAAERAWPSLWGCRAARGVEVTPHQPSYFVVPWSRKLQDLQGCVWVVV